MLRLEEGLIDIVAFEFDPIVLHPGAVVDESDEVGVGLAARLKG